LVAGFIAGLGGRDVTRDTIVKIAEKSFKSLKTGRVQKETEWVDLKE
jgi:hypothetical protein